MKAYKILKPYFRDSSLKKSKSIKRPIHGKPKGCSCLVANLTTAEFPKIWSELRQNQELCDGTIHCAEENVVFHIHRAIVSAVSPYFRALFTNILHCGNPEVSEVKVTNVPSEVLKLILDFAYTGTCNVTKENVEKLLPWADQFEVLGVIQLCCQFLFNELRPENCLGIFTYAQNYFCQNLENLGWRYILNNFMDIVQRSPELAGIEEELLVRLLQDDELNVQQEEMVFWAVKLWVEAKPQHRHQSLPSLLSYIRFGLMKMSYFNHVVMKWDFITENEACKEILLEASALFIRIATMQNDAPNISATSLAVDLNHPLAKPRIPYEILFAVGGWNSGSPTCFIEAYDIRSDHWFLYLNADSTPRAYHGIVSLNGLMYMIGGYDGTHYFNTVCQFDPIQRKWTDRACMHHSRCYVSTCSLDGRIYALGGYNGQTRLKSGERYMPSYNQWELIAPMHLERSDASATSFNGKVYIVGGYNGQEVLSSGEVYDPSTNQWTFICPLGTARSGVSLTTYHNYLYAIGGFDGISRLSSVERLNPVTSMEWQIAPDMLTPRSNFAAIELENSLFVVGGFNGYTTIQYVEFYSDANNEWSHASSMNLDRSALSVCLVKGLPNAIEYSYLSKVNFHGEGHSHPLENFSATGNDEANL